MDTHTYGLAILLYAIVATLHGIIPPYYNVAKNRLCICAIIICMIIVHCVVYDTLGSDMNPNNYFDDKVCEYMCMIVGTILWGSFEVLQTGNGRIVIWCIVCVCAGMYIVAHNMHMDYASID